MFGEQLVSSAINAIANKVTNDENVQMQESINERNIAFATAQAEKANRFNSAQSQVSRLISAGASPTAALASVLGHGSQSAVVPQATATAPTRVAPQFAVDDFVSGALQLKSEKLKQQSEQTNIQNAVKDNERKQEEHEYNMLKNKREKQSYESAQLATNALFDYISSGDLTMNDLKSWETILNKVPQFKDTDAYKAIAQDMGAREMVLAKVRANAETRSSTEAAEQAEYINSLNEIKRTNLNLSNDILEFEKTIKKIDSKKYPLLKNLELRRLQQAVSREDFDFSELVENADLRRELLGHQVSQAESEALIKEIQALKEEASAGYLRDSNLQKVYAVLGILEPLFDMFSKILVKRLGRK